MQLECLIYIRKYATPPSRRLGVTAKVSFCTFASASTNTRQKNFTRTRWNPVDDAAMHVRERAAGVVLLH